jgi:hypothetical protein
MEVLGGGRRIRSTVGPEILRIQGSLLRCSQDYQVGFVCRPKQVVKIVSKELGESRRIWIDEDPLDGEVVFALDRLHFLRLPCQLVQN